VSDIVSGLYQVGGQGITRHPREPAGIIPPAAEPGGKFEVPQRPHGSSSKAQGNQLDFF
jgi:hypothetical protein